MQKVIDHGLDVERDLGEGERIWIGVRGLRMKLRAGPW